MDGGKSSWAKSKESVNETVTGAAELVRSLDPEIVMFQEIDTDGTRSYHVDQKKLIDGILPEYTNVFAVNYDSPFLMYPLTQPHGKNHAGIGTYTKFDITSALRRSLPISESLSKLVDLDRCYSVSRIPVENGKELTIPSPMTILTAPNTSICGEGMKNTQKTDELRYSRANTLYRQIQARRAPETWTLDAALQEVDAAISLQPLPLYASLKAQLLYSLKRYAEACEQFLALNQTNLRAAENYLYAAQCQQMLADTAAVLALQDSAVACYTRPYVEAAAPALLMRANTLQSVGRYRDAVRDLNDYEHLKANTLSANFYYRRMQAEMRCRMFQQAIDDIERAVKMEPQEPLYHAEQAVVHFRCGQLDEAEAAARAAIALNPEFTDAHRILGVCLRAQGKENEAKAALQRAVDLGDTMAKDLLTP